LNKRTKHALKLRQKGLSFIKIGHDLGIGRERARQIVRKYEARLKALGGNDIYNGDPEKLANYKPEDLMKIRGLGPKRIGLIAKALESLGVIGDAEEWLK
jgi:hypothetical protein